MSVPVTRPIHTPTRPWLGLALLGLPTLLLAMDLSVLHLALPSLSADLDADSIQQLWIVDIYAFMIAGLLVTMGALGDRVGRRRLLLLGAGAFTACSVLAAFSRTPETLILARALMGVAGATLMPSTLALIGELFAEPRARGTAIGVWVACFMGGVALGPLVGGALLSLFWWGSVFLLAVPIMGTLLVLGTRLLPESRDPHAASTIDPPSVALSLLALLPATYGVKELARDGWQPQVGIALVVGLVAAVLFVHRQRRMSQPLLDLGLFRSRAVAGALAISLIGTSVAGGSILVLNLYLQTVLELSPLRAGVVMLPSGAALILGAVGAPAVAARTRAGFVLAGGFALSATGYAVLAGASPEQGLAPVLVGAVLTGAGSGPQAALLTQMVMSASPPDKAGSAAALSETSGELGMALGVALFGGLATALYRTDVTRDQPLAMTADEGIVAALEQARQLGGDPGAQFLARAQAAFAESMNAVAAAAALLCVVLAALAVMLGRHEEVPHPAVGAGSTDETPDHSERTPR